MEEKPFSLGILVGRFQTIHIGHEQMIRTALCLCSRVGIFVGSSQESGTQKNPFPYALRKRMLEKLFGDRVGVYPLPDLGVGNTAAWGDYVLENPENLSYGLQRKLEIARALAADPKVLLLDEPAAGLNPREVQELTKLILRIREERGMTILLIEHRLELVMSISEVIYVQDFGQTIAVGSSAEVQQNPEVIRAYLGDEEE